MSDIEILLYRYLKSTHTTDCSCTMPYENLVLFKDWSLFTTLVVLLSPNHSYAQMNSLILNPTYDSDRIHFGFTAELVDDITKLPRETKLYIYLKLDDTATNKMTEECIVKIISARLERKSCILITDQSNPHRIGKLVLPTHEHDDAMILLGTEKNLKLLKIFSENEMNLETNNDKWIDSEGEEIEEEY